MDFRRPCFTVPPLPDSSKRKGGNAKRNRRRREQRKRQKQEENNGNTEPDDVGKRHIGNTTNDSNVDNNDNDEAHLCDTEETVDTVTTSHTTNSRNKSAWNIPFDDISSMNATEYLQRVVCQANQLPEIFTSTSSSTSSLPPPPRPPQEARKNDCTHSIAHNNKRKLFPGSVSASLACFTKNNNNIQDDVSTLSLVGHLPLPPPTIHHLPNTFSSSLSSSSSSSLDYNNTTKEWIVETLESFQQLRWYLDQVREATKNNRDNNNNNGPPEQRKEAQRQPVPALRDRLAWQVFCLGQAEAEGNVGSYFDDHDGNDVDDYEVEEKDNINDTSNNNKEANNNKAANNDADEHNDNKDQQDDDSTIPAWRQNLPETGFSPTVSLLLQMDQVMVRAVLRNLAHVDNENDDDEEFPPLSYTSSSPCNRPSDRSNSLRLLSTLSRTLWMYALLACLEKPLHRQEAACLYQLVKRLCLLRASMTLLPPPTTAAAATTTTTTTSATTSSFNQQEYYQQRHELARCNVLITILAIYFEQGGERVMQVAETT